MKKIKKSILLMAAAAFAQQSYAQTQPTCSPFPKTISVSGSAEMEIVPDEIYVQVDLKEYKKKNGDKIEIEQIKRDFLAGCKAVGIPETDISVMNFTGSNANLVTKKKRKDPDMIATLSYQLKFSNTQKIDELVNKMDDEATSNFSVVRVSHSKMTDYRKQLKIKAVKESKEKAAYLCEAVNEQLGTTVTIEEPQEYFSGNNYMVANARMAMAEDAGGNSYGNNIDFRKIKLRFDVRVVYAIK